MVVATRCIVCDASPLIKTSAVLAPFLADRIFGWKPLYIEPSFGFRDIEEGHAYPLCNSLYCPECSMLFLDMRFDEEEMGRLYKDYRGKEYTALRSSYEKGYSSINDQLEGKRSDYLEKVESLLSGYFQEGISVLDFGGDDGMNTPFIETAEVVHILDISGKQAHHRAKNVTIEEIFDNHYEYSLITCMQVLEHVSDPHAIVRQLYELSRTDTLIYIEIPLESLMIDPVGTFYTQKRLWHEHINFFSSKALKRLAELNGLKIIEDRTITVAPEKYIQAIVCKQVS